MSTHELSQAALLAVSDEPDPDCVIEFTHLPSWNDFNAISGHMQARSSFIRKWKFIGERKVIDWAEARDLPYELYFEYYGKHNEHRRERLRLKLPFFLRPVVLDCRVWRPDARPYDVDNICLKHVLDGFVDARLLVGDDARFIKEVSRVYEGVDETLALTRDERQERKVIQDARRSRGKAPKRMPLRAHFRLEFFKLS